jgi:hypothetical protein
VLRRPAEAVVLVSPGRRATPGRCVTTAFDQSERPADQPAACHGDEHPCDDDDREQRDPVGHRRATVALHPDGIGGVSGKQDTCESAAGAAENGAKSGLLQTAYLVGLEVDAYRVSNKRQDRL